VEAEDRLLWSRKNWISWRRRHVFFYSHKGISDCIMLLILDYKWGDICIVIHNVDVQTSWLLQVLLPLRQRVDQIQLHILNTSPHPQQTTHQTIPPTILVLHLHPHRRPTQKQTTHRQNHLPRQITSTHSSWPEHSVEFLADR